MDKDEYSKHPIITILVIQKTRVELRTYIMEEQRLSTARIPGGAVEQCCKSVTPIGWATRGCLV